MYLFIDWILFAPVNVCEPQLGWWMPLFVKREILKWVLNGLTDLEVGDVGLGLNDL